MHAYEMHACERYVPVSKRCMPVRCPPVTCMPVKMHAYDRSCLLELLTYERHTCKRLISIREVYLRAIYIDERSMPTHRRISDRRVFQSVHLRGVQYIS
jgi:hypothetical protein